MAGESHPDRRVRSRLNPLRTSVLFDVLPTTLHAIEGLSCGEGNPPHPSWWRAIVPQSVRACFKCLAPSCHRDREHLSLHLGGALRPPSIGRLLRSNLGHLAAGPVRSGLRDLPLGKLQLLVGAALLWR